MELGVERKRFKTLPGSITDDNQLLHADESGAVSTIERRVDMRVSCRLCHPSKDCAGTFPSQTPQLLTSMQLPSLCKSSREHGRRVSP